VSNRLLPAWAYVPFNLAVAVIVFVLARRTVEPAEMGLTAWARGARWGVAIVVVTLLVYILAAIVLPDLFEDRRVEDGVAQLVYHPLVRIPLGTVLLEELSFRGALPAVFARRWSVLRGYVVASILFGFWHVLPAWSIGDVNPVADDVLGDGWVGQTAGIAFAVAGTFVGGMLLCVLREWSRSLLAPALVHVGTNSLGYTFAWFMS
jgi:uncharacterized protein